MLTAEWKVTRASIIQHLAALGDQIVASETVFSLHHRGFSLQSRSWKPMAVHSPSPEAGLVRPYIAAAVVVSRRAFVIGSSQMLIKMFLQLGIIIPPFRRQIIISSSAVGVE